MDKIIALTESSPQGVVIEEAQFTKFMQTTPIWYYFKIAQSNYLSYTKEEKMKLINDYYTSMQQGKLVSIIFLFKVRRIFEQTVK